jgi:hypothetical protein
MKWAEQVLALEQPVENFFPNQNDHARVTDMDLAWRRATYKDLLQVSDLLIAEVIEESDR